MIEILKQALDALVVEQYAVKLFNLVPKPHITKAIASLNQAIAELESQELVAIEYWAQHTMESGCWVKTSIMAKATAEKMLSGEFGDMFPQGRIIEPTPSQRTWVDLTQQEIDELDEQSPSLHDFVQNLMSKIKEKNT